jgi:hypothetical protein
MTDWAYAFAAAAETFGRALTAVTPTVSDTVLPEDEFGGGMAAVTV